MENATIKLKKPLSNGKDELVLDFDSINGQTLIQCEKDAKRDDPTITIPNLSQVYLAKVAAQAAGVRYDDICALPGGTFGKVLVEVRNFLLGADN